MIKIFARRHENRDQIVLWIAEFQEPFSGYSKIRFAEPLKWGEFTQVDRFPEEPLMFMHPKDFKMSLDEFHYAGIKEENPDKEIINALKSHIELLKEQIKEMTGVIKVLANKENIYAIPHN